MTRQLSIALPLLLWLAQPTECHAQQTLADHEHYVDSLAYSPDGKQLASGSFDKTIKLWDVGR